MSEFPELKINNTINLFYRRELTVFCVHWYLARATTSLNDKNDIQVGQ